MGAKQHAVKAGKAKLKKYHNKRDFSKTPEPFAAKALMGPKARALILFGKAQAKKAGKPIFVMQKHDASRLHYDFRMEVDGVLASWAVPKGPSTDPDDKRLAIMTEDHPYEYAWFEGIIPSGYGAGTVIVWDIGTYEVLEWEGKKLTIEDSIKKGHIKIILDGTKLKGGYTLTRLKDSKNWLMIKKKDSFATASEVTKLRPKSVLSGKTLQDIEKMHHSS